MSGVYEVRVEAPGFAPKVETVDLRTVPDATLDIRLEPGRITEQIIVTPTRSAQPWADVPASVTVLRSEEIRRSPAVVADDVLRRPRSSAGKSVLSWTRAFPRRRPALLKAI